MTTASTIVFITGVGRGIGQALARAYLAQPNTTVIGSVRNKADPKYQDLKSSPAASGSKLILVTIESSSQTDPHQAVDEIKAAGIDHVDIASANAGFSPPPAPLETIEIKAMEEAFRVNTLGPLILFQALKPLLDKSSAPKWLSVSTAVGSIANIEVYGLSALGAYGVSKAGLNWITA
jgi:NAD(P)-dependent dehydrogenase (short-subunit alcohol dehydrogenase family)